MEPAMSNAGPELNSESRAVAATRPGSIMAPRTSDSAIREAIVSQFSHGSRYAQQILVDVKDGEVTLTGDVPHKLMKRRLVETALSVRGVLRVRSRLDIIFAAPWPEAN
jgi:osmotically-inducible protein OsmY